MGWVATMTTPRSTRLAKLPDDRAVVGKMEGRRSPVVERLDTRPLRMRRHGRVVATTLVSSVQSYLDVERC